MGRRTIVAALPAGLAGLVVVGLFAQGAFGARTEPPPTPLGPAVVIDLTPGATAGDPQVDAGPVPAADPAPAGRSEDDPDDPDDGLDDQDDSDSDSDSGDKSDSDDENDPGDVHDPDDDLDDVNDDDVDDDDVDDSDQGDEEDDDERDDDQDVDEAQGPR